MLMNKRVVDFDMFGVFMNDIIMGNIDCTLVIAIERGGMFDIDAHITYEMLKP